MPYPLISGGNIAQFEMVSVLREKFDIIMVFPLKDANKTDFTNLEKALPDVTFLPFYPGRRTRLISGFKKMSSLLSRLYTKLLTINKPLSDTDKFLIKHSTLFRSRRIDFDSDFVNHVLNSIKQVPEIKYIQVDFFEFLYLKKYLPKHIKSIFIHHELRYVREARELSLLTVDIPYLNKLYERNKKFEIDGLTKYNKVVTVSIDDRNELIKYLDNKKVYSSPLTIKYHNIRYKPFTFNNSLVFLGGGQHFPNKEAIHWFLNNCWMNLKQSHPNLSLDIVGRWEQSFIDNCNSFPDINFLGFVDDLSQILNNRIFIVPIRIGSGMRMKIIESVINCLPFVTTTVGVEGLNFKKNVDCLIGDTPTDFNDQIIRLIKDQAFATQIASNAVQTLIKDYAYDNVVRLRLDMYDTV